jgi:type I restriction enzyme S subunit
VSGSAQPQITIDGLYDAEFTLPPQGFISKFSSIVTKWEEKKLNNFHQIQTLEKLRDNLLPKLMSGEVKVCYD